MAATRENVLAAINEYFTNNKRRAPAKAIADMVGDNLINTKAIIKALVDDGTVNSSRGRNGGAKPADAADARDIATQNLTAALVDDVADQFAALVQQLEDSESQSAVA